MVLKLLLPTESRLTVVKGGNGGTVSSYLNNALSQNIDSRDKGEFSVSSHCPAQFSERQPRALGITPPTVHPLTSS